MQAEERIKCCKCKKKFYAVGFGVNRFGDRLKSCLECGERRKIKAKAKVKVKAEIKCVDETVYDNDEKGCIMCRWKEGKKPLSEFSLITKGNNKGTYSRYCKSCTLIRKNYDSERFDVKITCECGATIGQFYRSRHLETEKHKVYMQSEKPASLIPYKKTNLEAQRGHHFFFEKMISLVEIVLICRSAFKSWKTAEQQQNNSRKTEQ